MPPATKLVDFAEALRTRKTKGTKVLDLLLASPPGLQAQLGANWPDFVTGGPVKGVKNKWSGALLTAQGLSTDDLAHIDSWPEAQKAAIHGAILNACGNANSKVEFFWELIDESRERTIISDDGAGHLVITFQSPRANVKYRGPDDVTVDVTPQQ